MNTKILILMSMIVTTFACYAADNDERNISKYNAPKTTDPIIKHGVAAAISCTAFCIAATALCGYGSCQVPEPEPNPCEHVIAKTTAITASAALLSTIYNCGELIKAWNNHHQQKKDA